MKRIITLVCLATLAGVATLSAADNPFTGTWKLNQAKSKFTGTMVKYEEKSPGVFGYSSASVQYDFKVDGKEAPGPFGYTVIWKKINDNTWETIAKVKGNVTSTDRVGLSKDGREMTVTSTGKRPDGQPFKDVEVFQRTGGGPGLAGTWKNTKFNMSAPTVMEIKADEKGMDVSFVDWKAGYKVQFDGKDYPAYGPTVPAGHTMANKQTDPRTIEFVQKYQGKTLYVGTMKVSPDGKTLTWESWPPNMKQETTVEVYEK